MQSNELIDKFYIHTPNEEEDPVTQNETTHVR